MIKAFVFCLACLAFAVPDTGEAQSLPEDSVSLFQMQHTVIQPGGEPVGAVLSLAQDSDGFLWLTTLKGDLLRYDGEKMTAPYAGVLAPFEAPVTILLGPRGQSGDLWIGHRRNGLTHIVHGGATHYDGGVIPPGSVQILRRDNHGVVWAMTPHGVVRFVDGRWQVLPASLGWDKPHPQLLTIDKATGDVFVLDAVHGTLVSRGGTSRFEPVAREALFRADAGLPPGAGWGLPADSDGIQLAATDGSVWAAPDTGIDRYRWSAGAWVGAPDVKERMSYADGLSSSQVYGMIEDHEGDVWLATTRGLDRFRRTHFTPLVFSEPPEFPAIAAAPDGSVWVTSTTQPPFRYARGKFEKIDGIGDGVSAVAGMKDGSILLAGRRGLLRWREGVVDVLPVPGTIAGAGDRFRQILEAKDGSVWVVVATYGLYHVEGTQWTRVNGQAGLPAATPSFVRRLPDGGIGLAYENGALYGLNDGKSRILLPPGARVGAPTDWLPEPEGMWLAGSRGLIHVGAQGTVSVRRPDGRPYIAVSGMVRDQRGDFWIFHQDGVDRLTPGSVRRAASGQVPVDVSHTNLGEGYRENAAGVIPVSSLMADASGMIWAAANTGVAFINPTRDSVNAIRPKVFIDTIDADQTPRPAADGITVAPLTHAVRFDYTAPMLRRPEQTRFEYRLEGVDEQWQRAGNRRSAYYTNLAPGAYAFRVRAFNEDGLQSERDAVLHFHVSPAWYQTWWFGVAVLIVVTLLCWVVYVARIRVVTRRLRIRMDERERIARDLHDTLLQGFQGLALRFAAIRQHVGTEKAGVMIDRALLRADDVLVEGREKVTALRRADAGLGMSGDFASALHAIGQEYSDVHPAVYRVIVLGRPRALRWETCENLAALTREAVLNALQHANASTVTAEVTYSRRTLTISVVDDGQGFDQTVEKAGHWGLRGMRERARVLDAALDIVSTPGKGSSISIVVRGTRAYL